MSKGSSFERELSVKLSKWVSKGKRDDLFWRSDASGARFTQRKKQGKDTALQAGDITVSDPEGLFLIQAWSIEAKTGYGKKRESLSKKTGTMNTTMVRWDAFDFIDSSQKKPILLLMWEQCSRDAKLTKREPVLIFRRNGRKPCICINNSYFKKLKDIWKTPPVYIAVNSRLVVMNLAEFMNWIKDIHSTIIQLGGQK